MIKPPRNSGVRAKPTNHFLDGIARAFAALAVAAVAAMPAMPAHTPETRAPDNSLTDEQHELIRELFEKFPDAESLQALRARITYTIQQRGVAALNAEENLPFFGKADGVRVVEFSDYRCGYCKRMFPLLMAENARVEVVEFPVLGEMSVRAARFALAARKQDGYADFHIALMSKRQIDDAAIADAAAAAGLDFARLEEDSEGADISEELQKNRRLAAALQVRGTPFLVIGNRTVPGAVNAERLKELLAADQQ